MKSTSLGEPAYNKPFFLAGTPPRCSSPLRCSVFLGDARKCYVFLWFSNGFRQHCAELKPQTTKRKYVPQIWNAALGVKCYCSQWFLMVSR